MVDFKINFRNYDEAEVSLPIRAFTAACDIAAERNRTVSDVAGDILTNACGVMKDILGQPTPVAIRNTRDETHVKLCFLKAAAKNIPDGSGFYFTGDTERLAEALYTKAFKLGILTV